MQTLDYIVLVFYLLGIVAVGLFCARQNKSASDMFAAGGQSPWWTSGLSAFMTMFSANTFVVWGGIAYQHGTVAVAINLCYGIAALLAGFTVLLAAIQSTLDERRHETAILRTLGADRRSIHRGLLAEFLTLGALAGGLAALAATVVSAWLAIQVFHFPYQGNAWVWMIGILGGSLGIGIAGLLGTRQVLRHPPMESLRRL